MLHPRVANTHQHIESQLQPEELHTVSGLGFHPADEVRVRGSMRSSSTMTTPLTPDWSTRAKALSMTLIPISLARSHLSIQTPLSKQLSPNNPYFRISSLTKARTIYRTAVFNGRNFQKNQVSSGKLKKTNVGNPYSRKSLPLAPFTYPGTGCLQRNRSNRKPLVTWQRRSGGGCTSRNDGSWCPNLF